MDQVSSAPATATGGGSGLRAIGEAIGLLLAAFVISIALGVAFTVPLVVFSADVESPGVFLGFAAIGQLAFLAVGYVYLRDRGGIPIARPTRRDVRYAIGGIALAIAAVTALSILATIVGVAPTESVFDEPIMSEPTLALGLAALSIVLVAPAEELLFRGAIQGRLRESFGPLGAIAGASVAFGSLHVANFSGSVSGVLTGVAIVTVGGAIFGWIYERTGNLLVPIVAHGGYNALLLVLTFLTI